MEKERPLILQLANEAKGLISGRKRKTEAKAKSAPTKRSSDPKP